MNSSQSGHTKCTHSHSGLMSVWVIQFSQAVMRLKRRAHTTFLNVHANAVPFLLFSSNTLWKGCFFEQPSLPLSLSLFFCHPICGSLVIWRILVKLNVKMKQIFRSQTPKKFRLILFILKTNDFSSCYTKRRKTIFSLQKFIAIQLFYFCMCSFGLINFHQF